MSELSLTKTEKTFYLVSIILLFQITRNINTILYVSLLFIFYGILYIQYFFKNPKTFKVRLKTNELIFVFTLIWIPIISLFHIDMNDYMKALPRYLVTFPFILFCVIYSRDFSEVLIRKILRLLCVFMALASLTLPFQIVFGAIDFFADTSYREGMVRYSSLAGSLTALGTFGGFSLVILLFSEKCLFSKKIKNILIIITIIGMLMSLQKSAVANIIIAFGLFIFFNNGKSNFFKRVAIVVGLIGFTYLLYLMFIQTEFALYAQQLLVYSFSKSSLGITQDLSDRLWDLPSGVIQYNHINCFDLFLGIGFPALGGTMGLSYPMAHNNYFDLVFSGGVLHLVSFLILMLSIPFQVFSKKFRGEKINFVDRSYSSVIFLVLINMLIGAGSFYQPIGAVFIFFIIFSYNSIREVSIKI